MPVYMATDQPSTSKLLQKKRKNSMQERFYKVFQDLQDLIEVNECSYEVYWKLNIDRCNLNNTAKLTQATIRSPSISVILRKNETKQDLIKFHHTVLFSPLQSTLIKAIRNNHLFIWPGLDENLVTKHLPPSLNTAKGHLQQKRQHLQSTKYPPSTDEETNLVKARLQRPLKKEKRRTESISSPRRRYT